MFDHNGPFTPQNGHPAPDSGGPGGAGLDPDWPHHSGEWVVPESAFGEQAAYEAQPLSPPDLEAFGADWQFEGDLTRLLRASAEEPAQYAEPPDAAPAPRAKAPRRRRRRRLSWARAPYQVTWFQLLSLLFAALTCAIVAMVSVLGGMVSYDPLRDLAAPGLPADLAGWWPVLVYGPWLVGSLSILRAAVHRKQAAHSWAVVVLFSAIAVFLSVLNSPRTIPELTVAGLPPVTALVSFHQFVRQITLTSPPRHALPRQRSAEPR